jgi:Xaa-Pro dipeptidase
MTALASTGIAALPEGGRVDFTRLRRERRQRVLEAMAAAGVDLLMLGRPANIAFASGARQLWTAGTRPFAPACVVVAATGRVHLLSTWDEGVPDEIPHGDLYGLSWNPAISAARLRAIAGLAEARRVATDGWGPGTGGLVSTLCPRVDSADVLDGGRIMRQARLAKSPDEMACLATAAAAAEAGLEALTEGLSPGVTERDLVGRWSERMATLGLACPPTEGVAWVCSGAGPGRPQRVATDRALVAGDLVALQPGASFAGYEITVGRTRHVASGPPPGLAAERAVLVNRAALDAVIGLCRPGATGAELIEAWSDHGGRLLGEPLAWGLGLGVEAPVIGPDGIGHRAIIRAGTVLAVQAWTVHEGVGAILEQDVVAVGPEGPTLLTRSRSGLAGAARRA